MLRLVKNWIFLCQPPESKGSGGWWPMDQTIVRMIGKEEHLEITFKVACQR